MTPLVDIVMPTYNHERFIAQAIESVLAQKTTFAYRLIIGDDCSTDGTQAIIRSYAAQHPDKIEFIFSPVNLGIHHRNRVAVQLFKRCSARYVAMLEGDDYWTDPQKLQKQVEFLESHPECALCFHNAEMFFDDGSQPSFYSRPADQKEISTLEDVVAGLVPITCSILYRNELLRELPDCYFQVRTPDWMISLLLAEHGKLGYLNEVMAAYRLHAGGIWSSLPQQEQIKEHFHTYKVIDAHLKFKHHRLIAAQIKSWRETLAHERGRHARSCLDQYHRLVGKGEIRKGVRLLLEAARSAPLEVLRPRRFAAVLKNGLIGVFWRNTVQN
jgi:glycosyltransferase involved in cell wall biosynthesis